MAYTDVIFDLDDTLINTTEQLIPIAIKILREILVSYEISITTDELFQLRKDFFNTNPRESFNTHLVCLFFNLSDQSEVLNKLHEAFYNIPLPENIMLTPDAELVLSKLNQRLHLVTSGSKSTQSKKIKAAGIEKYFYEWKCAEDEVSISKSDIFKSLISKMPPSNFLVVGNRIDNEIKAANKLNIKSCLFRFGEYKQLVPLSSEEEPDYKVDSLNEVIKLCQ